MSRRRRRHRRRLCVIDPCQRCCNALLPGYQGGLTLDSASGAAKPCDDQLNKPCYACYLFRQHADPAKQKGAQWVRSLLPLAAAAWRSRALQEGAGDGGLRMPGLALPARPAAHAHPWPLPPALQAFNNPTDPTVPPKTCRYDSPSKGTKYCQAGQQDHVMVLVRPGWLGVHEGKTPSLCLGRARGMRTDGATALQQPVPCRMGGDRG